MYTSYQIIINGRVQGVFFRATAKKVADELEICGWVKNTDDGCVEIHAKGDELMLTPCLSTGLT
ncbi:MAG: acylphosphatase [Candidatus Peribacteraceae bacterium]|nr:acylphosphatase [Candidatus Peribacteraceae bacterium]